MISGEQITGSNIPEDHELRQQMLVKFMSWLDSRGVLYIPLDVREDINDSFAEDAMDEFRGNLNGWGRELVRRSA